MFICAPDNYFKTDLKKKVDLSFKAMLMAFLRLCGSHSSGISVQRHVSDIRL